MSRHRELTCTNPGCKYDMRHEASCQHGNTTPWCYVTQMETDLGGIEIVFVEHNWVSEVCAECGWER
jgi:hypothetical protein